MKVKCAISHEECRGTAYLHSLCLEPVYGGYTTEVCDARPVRRQTDSSSQNITARWSVGSTQHCEQ